MPLHDCDELLATLKVRGQVPVSAGTWTAAELLKAMSNEAETWLQPLLIKAKGEFNVLVQDLPFVAAQADYRPTYRAAAIREVSRLMADGHEVSIEELTPPQRTDLGVMPSRQGVPMFYSWKSGVLTLWPTPGQTGDSVRVKYHARMNRMVSAADACIITAITPGGGSGGSTRLTVALASTSTGGIPAAMTTGAGLTQKMDLIRGTPPFDLMAFDLTPAAAWTTTGTSIDIAAASLPSSLAVGDYIAAFRQTPVPNMPPELHVCAALRAAGIVVKSKGDKNLAASLLEEAAAKEMSLLTGILEPRSKGNVHRLVTRRFR